MLATITYPANKFFFHTYRRSAFDWSWNVEVCEGNLSEFVVIKEWKNLPQQEALAVMSEAIDMVHVMNCEAGETRQFFIEELL